MTTSNRPGIRLAPGPPGPDLGVGSDLEALERLLDVDGARIVDVGCGDGALARGLARQGARVLGLEPDPEQAARNRAAPPAAGVRLIEADGGHIPMSDGAADGVVFARSLHHLPAPRMAPALAEARRVLRRPGGLLYVLEPLAEGPFFELMRPFHDETAVRAAAYRALQGLVPERFAREYERRYTLILRFPDFAAFVERMMGASFNRYRRDEIETDEVRRRFEAGREGPDHAFAQPMRISLFLTG